MPVEVDRVEEPDRLPRSPPKSCSDDAIGSSVNVMLSNDAVDELGRDRLARCLLDPAGDERFGFGPDPSPMKSIAVAEALDQLLHDVGVVVEELGAHDEVRRDVLALGPQVALVDEDLAAALVDEAGRPGFRHPGAVDLAGLERVEGLRVLLREDLHVATAGGVGLVALVLQPGAQRDVLRVAELRRGELLALQVLRRS